MKKILVLSLLILIAVPINGDSSSALDLNSLSSKDQNGNDFFSSMERIILNDPEGGVDVAFLRKEKEILATLKDKYNVIISDSCRRLKSPIYTTVDRINYYYKAKHKFSSNSEESAKQSLAMSLNAMKTNNYHCDDAKKQLPKIMKFIEDYNEFASKTYSEARINIDKETEEYFARKKAKGEAERLRAEEEERKRKIEEKKRIEAELQEQAIIVDKISTYAKKNKELFEKQSRKLRKEISGVWQQDKINWKFDLMNNVVTVSDGKEKKSFPVLIGDFDSELESITLYVVQDEKLFTAKSGNPVGMVIRKIKKSNKEFILGFSQTDGKTTSYEVLLSFIDNL